MSNNTTSFCNISLFCLRLTDKYYITTLRTAHSGQLAQIQIMTVSGSAQLTTFWFYMKYYHTIIDKTFINKKHRKQHFSKETIHKFYFKTLSIRLDLNNMNKIIISQIMYHSYCYFCIIVASKLNAP